MSTPTAHSHLCQLKIDPLLNSLGPKWALSILYQNLSLSLSVSLERQQFIALKEVLSIIKGTLYFESGAMEMVESN